VELLLGCGSRRKKLIDPNGTGWSNLVTLDINPDHTPDVVWDLTKKPWPFDDNTFEEVHAIEVLEHLGQQGDYKAFFSDFSEIWRVLKPDGVFFGSSPSLDSRWLWGDPGHCRAISPESMTYLCQRAYTEQVGKTAITDYRFCYEADFEPQIFEEKNGTFIYVLQAVKPSRLEPPRR
jgi:SAM-dependent methyltransferase